MMDDSRDVDGILSTDLVEFLNTEFGNDISKLSKGHFLLEKITEYEKELERKANPFNLDPHMSSFMENADSALKKINELKITNETLQKSADTELEQFLPIKKQFISHVQQLKELENSICYLNWILKVEDANSHMEEALKNNVTSQVILVFTEIKEIWQKLQDSDCKHLVEYVEKTMLYWHDILSEKFGNEFQKVLNSLHWPVLSPNLSTPQNHSPDVVIKFNNLFKAIYKIQLPDKFIKSLNGKENLEVCSILLPLQLMLQPLQKRFVFHFMSKKPTNRLDKPEWYLTQILTWISNNTDFIEKLVQHCLDKEHLTHINARAEFMKGLVHLAIIRLKSDLPCLINDDALLSHTIDEVLLFVNELKNQGYPSTFPNIIELLTEGPYFSRWQSLEHQSALEKMDKFLNSDSAWKPRYQEEGDAEDLQVPESAELFITLLLTMTERYQHLMDKDCQISFLNLQLELLDDFRLRLHQLSQCPIQETIQANYCGIINALYYVASILEEWNNLPFFLQLYAYKKKKSACLELLKDVGSQKLHLIQKKEPKSNDEEILSNSVFDEVIGLFVHMQKDLLHALGEHVIMDIKAKSRPYRKEKWFCLQILDDKSMEVSPAAYPMLEIINTSLHSLQDLLAKPLFTKVWQQIAMELNIYLFEEVILQNNFSEGGAAQLNFDMTRNLFPIFGSYTLNPSSYFKLVKDSCILLNLKYGPAMLLKETLKHHGYEMRNSALEEVGVHALTPSQALIVLSQRNYSNS